MFFFGSYGTLITLINFDYVIFFFWGGGWLFAVDLCIFWCGGGGRLLLVKCFFFCGLAVPENVCICFEVF